MKLLVVAATLLEVRPLLLEEATIMPQSNANRFSVTTLHRQPFEVLITGVGMQASIFATTQLLMKETFDLVIHAGIGGAFNRNLQIGEVVNITCDRFAQTGAEDDVAYLDIFELGLADPNAAPFAGGWLCPTLPNNIIPITLTNCKAITVDTVSGSDATRNKLNTKYEPDVESMEGAAIFYVCMQLNINCVQIRAISNYVEKRNKLNWNMPLAVEALNKTLNTIISSLPA